MKLKKISICSFRNIDEAVLFPESRFNIIVGNNAQGKTNILESIYLLGTMKSFRMHKNIDLIKIGSPFSLLKGWVEKDGIVREISISVEPASKKAKVDNKAITRASDFFGCLNMVVFSPEDITMVRGLPESRRRYLDRAVFSGDIRYLSIHQEFYKILKNRNVLLRSGKTDGLDTWTERLAEAGARLLLKRISYLEDISELLAEFYATISGLQEQADVRYRSSATGIKFPLPSPEEVGQRLFADLKKNSAEEFRRGTTLVGPHRDDIDLCIDGRALKVHGSQGEHRSFILALKMAEIEYIRKSYGNPPVLLLDDMTSELDGDRNRNFMEFLKSRDMQVFITTTSTDNLRLAQNANFTVFPIQGGRILQ
jgi:DNA replication and repair protein RecF